MKLFPDLPLTSPPTSFSPHLCGPVSALQVNILLLLTKQQSLHKISCQHSVFTKPLLQPLPWGSLFTQSRGEANGAMSWGISRGKRVCYLNIWFNVADRSLKLCTPHVALCDHHIYLCNFCTVPSFHSAMIMAPWQTEAAVGQALALPYKHMSCADSQSTSISTSHLKSSSPEPNLDVLAANWA